MKRSLSGILFLALCVAAVSAQTITVTKPAAGETLTVGHGYTIMWTKTGSMGSQVKITLRTAATLAEVMVIVDAAPNSGSFAWQMPGDVPVGSYKIRVRVKNEEVKGESGAFTIAAGPAVRKVPPIIKTPSDLLKFPALSISGADIVVYDDEFRITFAYKNSGRGDLPKSSEMPVKPSFRVLVDGKVLNQGTLTIPAFPAPPGWEVPSFYGGEIKLQASQTEFDEEWKIGNTLVIYINENKVNGMASDNKTYNLRQLALGRTFDAYINGATYDWKTETLKASIRIDGEFGTAKKFRFFNTGRPGRFVDDALGGFLKEYDLVSGQHYYELSHKVHLAGYPYKIDVYLGVLVLKPGSNLPDSHDLYHPNNTNHHFTFTRPSSAGPGRG